MRVPNLSLRGVQISTENLPAGPRRDRLRRFKRASQWQQVRQTGFVGARYWPRPLPPRRARRQAYSHLIPSETCCSRRSVRPKRPLVWMNGQAPRITIAEVIIRRRGQAARPPCHSSKQPRAEVRPRQLAASFSTAFRRFARRPLHSRYRLRLAAPSETKSPGQCRGLALRTGSLNVSSGRPQVRPNRTCSWL